MVNPAIELSGKILSQVCFQQFYLSLHFDGGETIFVYQTESFLDQFMAKHDDARLQLLRLLGERVVIAYFDPTTSDLTLTFKKRKLKIAADPNVDQSYDLILGQETFAF